ncbi:hypothetical protein HaLaN_27572, partial [Haematococcus lacustris]
MASSLPPRPLILPGSFTNTRPCQWYAGEHEPRTAAGGEVNAGSHEQAGHPVQGVGMWVDPLLDPGNCMWNAFHAVPILEYRLEQLHAAMLWQ